MGGQAQLIYHEDKEYAAPLQGKLIKVDPDTGKVEVVGRRAASTLEMDAAMEEGVSAVPASEPPLPPPSKARGSDPLTAEEATLAHARPPMMTVALALAVVLVLVWAISFVWSRQREKRRRRRQPLQREMEGLLARPGGAWGWGPARRLATLSDSAHKRRALLDKALQADSPAAARDALDGLAAALKDAPLWVHEALAPLSLEEEAVAEVEGQRRRLLRELEEAADAGQDALCLLDTDAHARSSSSSAAASAAAGPSASPSVVRLRAGSVEEPELHLIAAVARAREALRISNSGDRDEQGQRADDGAAARLREQLGVAEGVLASIQHRRDVGVERQIEALKAACQQGIHAAAAAQPSQQEQRPSGGGAADLELRSPTPEEAQPPLLLQSGDGDGDGPSESEDELESSAVGKEMVGGGNGSSTTTSSRGDDTIGGEQASSAPSASTASASTALVATTTTSSTAVVVAGGERGEPDQAMLFNYISQSIHMSTMLHTIEARLAHLEEKLERQREIRGAHALRESGLARREREARKEQLRQRVLELAAARGQRDAERRAAERARREGDQVLLTYLLPVSFLVFGGGVLLASSDEHGAPSAFLLDALWRVPLHDLVYGACARQTKKGLTPAAAVKVVVHEPRRIAGAATEEGGHGSFAWPVLLQWAAAALLPAGGAAEVSACYVRHTVYLVLGLAGAGLLHHLMGSVGLSQHRAKLHVALLAYAFQRHILRVTWRGLRSLRHLLGLHALLWLAALGLDAGHAFTHRRLWLRAAVPALVLAVALYDAASYVDPKHPEQALVLMAHRAVDACLAGILGVSEDGGEEL